MTVRSTVSCSAPTALQVTVCNDLVVAVDYESLLRGAGLDSLDALFEASGDLLGKPGLDDWRERVRFMLMRDNVAHTLYLKRFRNPPTRAMRAVRASGSGASSVAGVEWEWMHQLARDGVACPVPVAFGEELEGAREVRSAVLSLAVPGDALERQTVKWGDEDRATVGLLLGPLADLVARFHNRGYIHRDLYLSHIFYDSGLPPDRSLHLIDLQRVMKPRWGRRRWIVKDLASLNYSTPPGLVSTTDRVRWLKHYLGASKLDGGAKRLVCRIVGKTRRIARHDRHRRARLRLRSSNR